MSVDLEAIAQRGRCEVSSLRLALPLLEQGYTPPFLARYRRDELGGIDESSLWALSSSLQTEREVAQRRDELHAAWEKTTLRDPSIGHAIKKSNSIRMLARLGRRLKAETSDNFSDATRLAVRVLNPRKGDGNDFAAIAASVDGISDAGAAVAGLDEALAKRLAGDPRIIGAAVRWLVKHARIHIVNVNDPHTGASEQPHKNKPAEKGKTDASPAAATSPNEQADGSQATDNNQADNNQADNSQAVESSSDEVASADQSSAVDESNAGDAVHTGGSDQADAKESSGVASANTSSDAVAAAEGPGDKSDGTPGASPKPDPPASTVESSSEETAEDAQTSVQAESEVTEAAASAGDSSPVSETANAASTEGTKEGAPADPSPANAAKSVKKEVASKGAAPAAKGPKKQKKISPRQRRRRWLVGVLKPLAGKRFNSDKLSSFQIVMLGRALRSQVAECSFEYDATKLVAELQRTASGINRQIEQQLREIVLNNEAAIRDAAESAWWDDLQERASSRLVAITADHLRRHINRGGVEAKVVMSIDAIGPRTAATTIVSSDGRVLHCEDLACQLSSSLRSQAVTKMGELIHTYHVDLIVISNGPARRASMIALGDLISQSPEKTIHWTLADRSGADAYASSSNADQEMRSTPRRFRAAAWLAFSVLQPAQALAKVDPLKLRLSSFQRELSDEALSRTLEDVMVSGASRGGVDVNSAPASWLSRLPGMNAELAEAIDSARRESLFDSRDAVAALDQWNSTTQSRQAIPFLRVFGSQEVLDGTLVHPEDYPLAKKLAASLEIELPPDAPPGYVPPDFSVQEPAAEPDRLSEAEPSPESKIEVEDFSSAGENAAEFAVDAGDANEGETSSSETDSPEQSTAEQANSDQANSDQADAAPQEDAETASSEKAESTQESATGDQQPTTPSADENSLDSKSAEDDSSESTDGSSGESAAEADATASTEPAEPKADAAAAEARPVSPVADIPEPIKRPRPERAKIEKCIKEWQIGSRRANQLVHWLCDPFGDSDATGNPPAVLSSMPSSKGLKPGDKVIGVVVGVMPFGVFVELAPDCSGLIHVSRISDTYVEDLHEAIQVGDVVTAWVTGIEEKRKRVALSAISPERDAELAAARHARNDRSRGGPPRGRGGDRTQSRGTPRGDGRGKQQGGHAQGGRGKPGGGRDQGRGGRPRDASRGGRSRDGRGRGREKKPESYRVVGKKEAKPITDAMQKGEEPLRSFGDLMQFFGSTDKAQAPEPPKSKKEPKEKKDTPAKSETEVPPSQVTAEQTNSAPAKPDDPAAAEQPASSDKPQAPAADSDATAKDVPSDAAQSGASKGANSDDAATDSPDAKPSSPADASTS